MEHVDCDMCGQRAQGGCGKCGMAKYCNRECQVDHWETIHKEFCVDKSIDIPQELIKEYGYESRESFLRGAQNGEIEGIEGKFTDWIKKRALVTKFWIRMRTSKGRSNLLRDIGSGKYDDDRASLDAIVKAASKSKKFSDLKLMAERRLGQLEGRGGGGGSDE